jgi:hypothetical protein
MTPDRISRYMIVRQAPLTRVYTVCKYRQPTINLNYFDTHFYTLPVREHNAYVNSVVAFLCERQAQVLCDSINHPSINQPAAAAAKTDAVLLSDLSYYTYQLGLPLVLICNSYCQGTMRDPYYEIILVNKPLLSTEETSMLSS